MSLFRPTTFRLPLRTPSLHTTRTLTTTPVFRLKEDATRTPEQVEQAKQDQIKEQKEGKGRWREDLASSGESNIKADKQRVRNTEGHIKQLQREGKERGETGEKGEM